MRISRLHIKETLNPGQTLTLDEDSAHYLRSVLRLKAGDALILFNGDGNECTSRITEVSRKAVRVALETVERRSVESALHIHLGLGIARGDRMDWSVQKAVELGANRITPVLTERCVVQFKGQTKPQRWQHWQKIVHHAAEQCGRTVLPEFAEITPLTVWASQQQGLRIFLDPYASASLTDLPPETGQATLLTGPEGGFADHERELAKQAGFVPVRLGQRILRTETASLAALAALQTLWGDFR